MSAFLRALDSCAKDLGGALPIPGYCKECDACGDDPDIQSDAFSSSRCETCGSGLAGERHYAHALIEGRDGRSASILHYDVCTDCLFYLANGDEPEGWAEAHDECDDE